MGDIKIRMTGPDGAFEVLAGKQRLLLEVDLGLQVEAVDVETGKRYLIERVINSLVAKPIEEH